MPNARAVLKQMSGDRVVGPALTVAVMGAHYALSFTPLGFSNRFAPLMLAVIYATFRGGTVPGLVSAVLAYTYFTLSFAAEGVFSSEPLLIWVRLGSWLVIFPLIVYLIGDLKKRVLAKQADEARRSLEAAMQASRMKSEFLANMSHEIRTPIHGVMGTVSILLDTSLSQEQRRYAETIRSSADSLLTLVNDVLDFSKVEAGKLDLESIGFDLDSILMDVERTLAISARQKGLSLLRAATADVPSRIQGDPARLRQVLLNLVTNAIKFTPSGQVRIETSRAVDGTGRACLRFEVADTGVGIAAAAIDRIFDAFSQADSSTTRRFGGTGLGLTICRRLVGLMGGEIGVRSEEGTGSVFWFSIPLVQCASGDDDVCRLGENVEACASAAGSGGTVECRLRVLVAEDNSINRLIAVKMLEKLGHDAIAVSNGAEALAALGSSSYDLVLMDCQMPELDGYAATQRIRATAEASWRSMPIIAMTANALQGDRERCLVAGMDDYVSKPMKTADLRKAIERTLQSLHPREG